LVSTGFLGSGRPADVALSADGARIYVAGTDGFVRVYSAETGQLISEWDVGTRLGGIDLSPDGNTLYVVEREPLAQYVSPAYHEAGSNWAIVTFYEVNTTTGEVVSHPVKLKGYEDGLFDLAAQPDGNVLLTTSLGIYSGGRSYLRLWQDDTKRYLSLQGLMSEEAVLSPSRGSKVLVGEKQGELYLYDDEWIVAWNDYPAKSQVNGGVQAYRGDGKLAAGHTGDGVLQVYDSDLHFVLDLSTVHGGRFKEGTISGLAFDAAGRNLYVLDNVTDSIVQISTSTWSIVQSIPVGVDFGLDPATAGEADYGNRLLVGPNARYFTVVTDTGLRIVANPTVSDTISGTAAAEILRGTGLNDILNGLDGDDRLLGGDGEDRLSGGTGADRLVGGPGNDSLQGGAGSDRLSGGAGNDVLRGDAASGSASADAFYFDAPLDSISNRDTIADFQPGLDRIHLDAAVFGNVGAAGVLAQDAFRTIGVEAADAEDRILYDRAGGALFYDLDGNGAAAAVQFASVTPGLRLSSTDFIVYGTPPAPPPPPAEPLNHRVSPLVTRDLGAWPPAGIALSPDGSRVYAASQDGFVRVYSPESGRLLDSWDVGRWLGGVDLSPDGRFLWAVERSPISQTVDYWNWFDNKFKVTVYRIDTATGKTTSFPTILTGSDDGFFDIAVQSEGKVIVTTSILKGWSGHVNLRELDPATGKYVELGPRPTADAILTSGDSATRFLLGELDTSGGGLHLFSAGAYIASHNFSSAFHSGIQAYHEQAKLVAQHTFTGGIHIFDEQLQLKLNISDLYDGSFRWSETSGLAFDPTGEFLYILDNVTDSIVQVAVDNGAVINFIPIGVDFAEQGPRGLDPLYGDRLLVGPGARYFTVVVDGRLRIVLNPFASDMIAGTEAGETLQGTGLADLLRGLGGDDLLIGGNGNDRLEGGAGDDRYRADAGDTIIEADGQGTDLVESGSSHVLADFVENLTLLGNAVAGTGNGLANILTGNAAANRLDGRGGADRMIGGAGNDVYVVNLAPADPTAARDVVIEAPGGGVDTVESSVSYTLGDHVERLVITGSAARNGTGNGLANSLLGNGAANILSGGAGDDVLRGGGGNDSLRGGTGDDRLFGGTGKDSLRGDSGADRFYFDNAPSAEHRDTIADFLPGTDSLYLAASIFTDVGAAGVLAPDAFHTLGVGAADAEDRILYDSALGALYYDRDGSGSAAPIQFASVTPGLALSSADFIIY
jgi:Ca2+-binding RTX toxin-like protein